MKEWTVRAAAGTGESECTNAKHEREHIPQ
jgi:hypothetical protein